MKHLTFILVFISASVFGQVSGVVKDSLTGKVIPYVNILIENEDAGTTTDLAGIFKLHEKFKDKRLIVYAPGYEIKKLPATISGEILLSAIKNEKKGQAIVLKKSKTMEAGTYSELDIKSFHNPTHTPVIFAKHIVFKGKNEDPLYIKALGISITSMGEGTKARIRFFEVNKDGSPGKEFYNNDIIISIPEGANHIETNLEKYKITFPKEGVFAGIEWLFIKENYYSKEATKDINGKVYEGFSAYMPAIGVYPTDDTGAWQYDGEWVKPVKHPKNKKDSFSNKYVQIAINLTLTN